MSAAARAENGRQSMGGHAVRGAFWTVGMSLGNKVITLVGQVALAWFLLPRDMGVVAMAASVIAWATFFTASGIDDLLVQRHDTYDRDAPQILWISLGFNFLALGVAAALTPFASRHFGDARVGKLMLIQAASWPLTTITLVLRPKLANLLRFRAIALTQFGQGIVFTCSAVVLASFGWGPYSLVWPIFIAAGFTALMLLLLLGGRLPLERPRPSRWGSYLAPGMMLMVGNFVSIMAVQVPNFIVGSFLDERRTGLYAWGYLVASQAAFLLVHNLRGLFTPLFSKLKDDAARLAEAVAKSAYLITAIVAPICLLQAFFAKPLISELFPDRWFRAADVVFWLSLGFGAQPVALIAQSALVASGRFAQALRLAVVQAGLIAVGVALGCLQVSVQGGVERAAMGAALGSALGLPFYLWVLRRELACPWSRLLDTLKAVALAALAFLAPYALERLRGRPGGLGAMALEALLYVAFLALLYRWVDPSIFGVLARLRRDRRAAATHATQAAVPAEAPAPAEAR